MTRASKVASGTIHLALRAHFAAPEWAYLAEVRNGTGYERSTARSADALAMSLWPSRGLELHGIEIKSDRGDWLREKRDPAKADAIGQFCDRWWLAIGDDKVATVDELPPCWGLLVYDGKKLRVARAAVRLAEPKPIDRLLLAAILRRSAEACEHHVHSRDVDAQVFAAAESRVERARADTEASVRLEYHETARDLALLQQRCAAFSAASGIDIAARWQDGRKLGEAVAIVRAASVETMRARLDAAAREMAEISAHAQRSSAALAALGVDSDPASRGAR